MTFFISIFKCGAIMCWVELKLSELRGSSVEHALNPCQNRNSSLANAKLEPIINKKPRHGFDLSKNEVPLSHGMKILRDKFIAHDNFLSIVTD